MGLALMSFLRLRAADTEDTRIMSADVKTYMILAEVYRGEDDCVCSPSLVRHRTDGTCCVCVRVQAL